MTHIYVREDGGGWPDSDPHERRRPECSLTGNPQDQHQDPHDAGTLGALACGKPMAAAWAGVAVPHPQPVLARAGCPNMSTPLAHEHSGKCPSGAVGEKVSAATSAGLRALRRFAPGAAEPTHPLQLPVGIASRVGEPAAVGGGLGAIGAPLLWIVVACGFQKTPNCIIDGHSNVHRYQSRIERNIKSLTADRPPGCYWWCCLGELSRRIVSANCLR